MELKKLVTGNVETSNDNKAEVAEEEKKFNLGVDFSYFTKGEEKVISAGTTEEPKRNLVKRLKLALQILMVRN